MLTESYTYTLGLLLATGDVHATVPNDLPLDGMSPFSIGEISCRIFILLNG